MEAGSRGADRRDAAGEVGPGDLRLLGQGQAATDQTFQFPDVARPVVAVQEFDRLGGEAGARPGGIAREFLAETARDLARAVAEARARGIIHRDLKPANVLLAASGRAGAGPIPKLTDFGLARRGDADGVTETGVVLDSPGYMAPEQTGLARDVGEVGPATDIHGLGAILHASLTGLAPYAGQSSWEMLVRSARGSPRSARALRRDVPRDLATIIDKCLHASPSRRYRSAGDVADDLERFLEGRPTSAPERWLKWARRRPALAASAALAVVASLGTVAGTVCHVAAINKSPRDLADEQGRTRAAQASATSARDQARRALGLLSDDVVRRMMERGAALNVDDLAFLRKVRAYYQEWPLELDPAAALNFRGSGLARVAAIFEAIDQHDDARSCREAAVEAYDEALRRGLGGPEMVSTRLVEGEPAVFDPTQILGRRIAPGSTWRSPANSSPPGTNPGRGPPRSRPPPATRRPPRPRRSSTPSPPRPRPDSPTRPHQGSTPPLAGGSPGPQPPSGPDTSGASAAIDRATPSGPSRRASSDRYFSPATGSVMWI